MLRWSFTYHVWTVSRPAVFSSSGAKSSSSPPCLPLWRKIRSNRCSALALADCQPFGVAALSVSVMVPGRRLSDRGRLERPAFLGVRRAFSRLATVRLSSETPGSSRKPPKPYSEMTFRVRYCSLGGSSVALARRGRNRADDRKGAWGSFCRAGRLGAARRTDSDASHTRERTCSRDWAGPGRAEKSTRPARTARL